MKPKTRILLLGAALYVLTCPVICSGQESEPLPVEQEAQGTTDESAIPLDPSVEEESGEPDFEVLSIWDFARMILILGAVVAVIFIIFQVLKRAGNPRPQSGEIIRLLGSQPLIGNKSLHLIEVGNQVFLVGVGDTSVSLVSEITDKESVDIVRLAAAQVQGRGTGERTFPDILQSVFRKRGPAATDTAPTIDNEAVFLRRQRERLRQL